MKCTVCYKKFSDILKHLRKNPGCESGYDVDHIVQQRRILRLEKMKARSKIQYDEEKSLRQKRYLTNRSQIRETQSKYKRRNKLSVRVKNLQYKFENRKSIKEKNAKYYTKKRSLINQKKRFYKHFKEKGALKYITSHQDHLFYHSLGICQPESMQSLNHSIEYYDGICMFCEEPQGVKIIGVNRQVCMHCLKAQCVICNSEVSPDPEFGCFHYSPDTGFLLRFMPEFCPLYSNHNFPRDASLTYPKNQKDCKICVNIKKDYPEYELFGELETQSVLREDFWSFEKQDVYVYICNLCDSKYNFICEFDLHMRSHTKYGKNVAIFGLVFTPQEHIIRHKRVGFNTFATIQNELMRISGISAVLSVFGNNRFESYASVKLNDEITAIASVLIGEGVDIWSEVDEFNSGPEYIKRIEILDVRNHFMLDKSTASEFEADYYKRRSFEKNLLCWNETFLPYDDTRIDGYWFRRSKSLLSSRCSLQLPCDRYQGFPRVPRRNFPSRVIQFLWKEVKNSPYCCCVSKFFCSTSTTIDKCLKKCCGKCLKEENALYVIESNEYTSESEANFSDESEKISDLDDEQEVSSGDNEDLD